MKHPSLNIRSTTLKQNTEHRMRIESWESYAPKGMFAVNFIQESLNAHGEVDTTNTYNYNMTRDEIDNLCRALSEV